MPTTDRATMTVAAGACVVSCLPLAVAAGPVVVAAGAVAAGTRAVAGAVRRSRRKRVEVVNSDNR
jgi:hypothetical protein